MGEGETDSIIESGTCFNCGLLCRRDILNSHLPSYYEITEEDRNNGRYFTFMENHAPRCFQRVDIGQEIRDLAGSPDFPPGPLSDRSIHRDAQNAAAEQITKRTRNCPTWFPYKPGISPKEHFEEYKMLQVEKDRREWEEELEKDRRDFELKLFEANQQVQQDSAKVVEGAERFNRHVTWFFIALAVLEVLGTGASIAVALWFPNGFRL